MTTKLSPAAFKALHKAALRPRGNICPIAGVYSAAEDALVASLDRQGFIKWDGPVPRINVAGRAAALSKATAQ